MGRIQSSLILLFLGLFFLSIVVFRHTWFYTNDLYIVLFVFLLIGGICLFFIGLFRLFTKWWYGIIAAITIEIGLVCIINTICFFQIRTLPDKVKGYLTGMYISGFMNCIQYDRACSQFDGQLQYTLKPGLHDFNNLEFTTKVEINKKGLRSSEKDLRNPEVIFLGDSYTMGWGVSEEKTFAKQFEKTVDKSCLNAGISSYGTAREYLMLKRLPTDSCRLLFIQYCENDLLENYMFYHKGEQLADEQELLEGYDRSVHINLLVKHYYPFKYIYWIIRQSNIVDLTRFERFFSRNVKEEKTESFTTDHRPYLTKVLKAIREYYKGPIVLFYLDRPVLQKVSGQLEEVIKENEDLGIHWIDMRRAELNEHDYFMLDMHLNDRGHKKVADFLSKFIISNQILH